MSARLVKVCLELGPYSGLVVLSEHKILCLVRIRGEDLVDKTDKLTFDKSDMVISLFNVCVM